MNELASQVGDEVTKDEPITTNPNVGGFGQEEKECILQDMSLGQRELKREAALEGHFVGCGPRNRVYAYCAFAFSCFIAQLSFVLSRG